MNSAKEKLEIYLQKNSTNQQFKIEQLTPDASTREYFRIPWKTSTAIACVYPESFDPGEQTFLDVTELFLEKDLPVAKIFDFDAEVGVIVQEDLGNEILRNVLERVETIKREELINECIQIIARIQAITAEAFRAGSIASKLKFDEEKFVWELNFFKTHYFESLKNSKLPSRLETELEKEFVELSRELETFARVLCHRDFHAANLMLDNSEKLRIIDHQDARIGSVCYDLVSLLLDRVLKIPEKDWLSEKKIFFLKSREELGLEILDLNQINYEFDLVTIQRCLKAIGTFSNQTANRGKTGYTEFIKPMFEIVLQACQNLDRFPLLQQILREELKS